MGFKGGGTLRYTILWDKRFIKCNNKMLKIQLIVGPQYFAGATYFQIADDRLPGVRLSHPGR